jgi:serine/threonine protein kinase
MTEIAGYRLQERIGMGGFGEVWRAIGPGGFPKALKILFGSRSGPQAETENSTKAATELIEAYINPPLR